MDFAEPYNNSGILIAKYQYWCQVRLLHWQMTNWKAQKKHQK